MASSARIDELKKKFDESPRRYFAPLANEYRKAGDPEQAIAICREFLPQQPGHMSGHIVYGQALYDAQHFDEARTVFDTALTLDPENLIALRSLGDIARLLGDPAGARGWYQRVLDADPRNDDIAALLTTLATEAAAEPAAETAAEPDAVATRAARNSDGVILGATPLDEAPPAAPVIATPPEGFVPQAEIPLVTPDADAAAPAPLDVAAPPTDELLDLGDLTIRVEAPVVPRVSTPRASLSAMGWDIERNDDMSFLPSAGPEAASEEPQAAGADEAPEEPEEPEAPVADAPEVAEFTLEDFGSPARAQEAPAPPVAMAAPEPVDPFSTETMAELYLSQGHAEDALRVYRTLLAQRPSDAALEAKIASVVAMTALTPAIPMQAVPAPEPEHELEPEPEPEPDADSAASEAAQELPDLDASGFGLDSPVGPAATIEAVVEISESVVGAAEEQAPEWGADAMTTAVGPSIREFLAPLAMHGAGAEAFAPEAAPEPSPVAPPPPVAAAEVVPVPSRAPVTPMKAAPSAGAPVAGTNTLLAPDAGPAGPQTVAEAGGSIDLLFGGGSVPTPDQAAAAALAGAFGVVEEEPLPPISGAPARRATEELSLDHVFRDSHAPQPPDTGGFSFDRFFEGSNQAPASPTRETPAGAPAADDGDADIEQFNSWLQGLKKR